MTRLFGVSALVLVAACSGTPASTPSTSSPVRVGPGQKLAARDVTLSSGPLRLFVRFDAGQEPWAAYVGDQAAAFLVAAERYLGVPHQIARARFYRDAEGASARGESFLIAGQTAVYHEGHWVGGYHARRGERGIFIKYGLTAPGRPALLDHELGHSWFDGLLWLSEGLVSFLPLALAKDGALALTAAERRAVWKFWGADDLRFPEDLPVQVDFRTLDKEHLLFFYRKAFKVQCLLYRELGPQGYQRFAQDLAKTSARLPDDAAALTLLGTIKPATDFRALLAGWVFEGPYTTPRSQACKGLGLVRGGSAAPSAPARGGTDAPASQ